MQQTENSRTANENSGRRDALIIFSVALATFMGRLDSYIVNVSLPTMARYFDTGLSDISRVVFIYVLATASTLLMFGKLADRAGLKKLFIWGYFLFTGGSLLCGVSPGIDVLTMSRFVQGLGSSMLAATSLAIISRHIPREKTGRAFGIFTSASALGITLGAPLGGFITGFLSWHWIFLINIPIGIAAIVLAGKAIPGRAAHEEGSMAAARFDVPGVVLSMAGISLLLFALNNGRTYGWTSLGIVSGFILSALCGVAFIAREKSFAFPLLDVSLFRNPGFTFPILANFIIFVTMAAHNFLMPFYLDLLKHMTPARIGLFLMIYSVVFVVVPLAAGRYSEKTGPLFISTLGMAITAFSFFLFSFTLHLGGLLFVVAFFVIRAIGNGMFLPANNILIMGSTEREAGAVSGILNTVNYLGATIGVVLFETIFSQITHQAESGQTLLRAGLTDATLQAGFRYVFVILGFISIAGTIFSYLTRHPAKRTGKEFAP